MNRMDLQAALEDLLGTRQVYFQPPEDIKMTYPSIVYHLEDLPPDYANDKPYRIVAEYLITLITRNPDDPLVQKLAAMPCTRFDRYYTAANLNHYQYRVTFT